MLLLVKNYADSPEKVFITDTALGVLLLLFAALLAYAGTVCVTHHNTIMNSYVNVNIRQIEIDRNICYGLFGLSFGQYDCCICCKEIYHFYNMNLIIRIHYWCMFIQIECRLPKVYVFTLLYKFDISHIYQSH